MPGNRLMKLGANSSSTNVLADKARENALIPRDLPDRAVFPCRTDKHDPKKEN